MAEIERTRRQGPSRSILTPQADYWEEDLPGRDEEQTYKPQLIRINKKNDIWMEIPCYTNKSWWVLWFLIAIMTVVIIFYICITFKALVYVPILIIALTSLFVFSSFWWFAFRAVMYSPRWTPIRFNRKRQKVYVYDFQQRWNPWARWPVVVKVFDWQDIYGERLFWSGRYTFGSQLACAVCSSGTHQVLHRFPVTPVVGDIRMVWAEWSHICQYMQGRGVPTTPMFTDHPASWTPEGHQYRWPEDLDRESKTAP
ncbi:hypothetical protein GJV06_07570 [Enterobacteriaceae bacterium RIT691]|nr:hypothetical protein [Enterobacteriaceae bacterium RIT691]